MPVATIAARMVQVLPTKRNYRTTNPPTVALMETRSKISTAIRIFICVVTIVITLSGSIVAQDSPGIEEEYGLAAGFYSRSQWEQAEPAFRKIIQQYSGSSQSILSEFYLPEVLIQQNVGSLAYASGYHSFGGQNLKRSVSRTSISLSTPAAPK